MQATFCCAGIYTVSEHAIEDAAVEGDYMVAASLGRFSLLKINPDATRKFQVA